MSHVQSMLAVIIAFLVVIPNLLVPIAISTPLEIQNLNPGIIKNLALSYAYDISSLREDFPLLIPALGAKRGAQIGNGNLKADIFVLIFPATSREKVAATEIISSAATEFFSNLKKSLDAPSMLGDLYTTIYQKLVEAGAQPAFIPYQNVSFLVLTVIWIKPKRMEEGLTDLITGLGLSTVKATADGIITVAIVLAGNTLDDIGEKAKIEAKKIISSIVNQGKGETNSIFNSLAQQLENIQCSCEHYCTINNETKCDSFKAELNIKDDLSKLSQNLNGFANNAVHDVAKQTHDAFINRATESKNQVRENTCSASNLCGIFSDDADKISDQIISQFAGIIYDNLNQGLSSKFKDLVNSVFNNVRESVSGTSSSCEEAKQIARNSLQSVENEIIRRLNNLEYELSKRANETIDSEINELKDTVNNIVYTIGNGINDAISQAEEPVKETIGNAVQSVISNAVSSTSVPVFIVYAVGQGLFQALQTWVKSVSVTCLLDSSSMNNNPPVDERIIVIEKQENSQQLNVRFPDKGEKVSAKGSPPSFDQIASAAKGFLRGILGTAASLIGAGDVIQKAFDSVPTFVLVNIKMEEASKYVVAQPKPGIYAMEMNLNIETGADAVMQFGEGLKKALFGDKEQPNNKYTEKLKDSLDKSIQQSSGKVNVQVNLEKGINLIVPYLVLPPYFVTERVDIVNGTVTIWLTAVYDFAALLRPRLEKMRNKLYELRYTAVGAEQELENIEKEISKSWEDLIDEIIEKVFNLAIDRAEKTTEGHQDEAGELSDIIKPFIKIVKQSIKNRVKNLINEAFKKYLESILDPVRGLIRNSVKLIDQGIDVISTVDQLITTGFTILKIKITNCRKMSIVALIPGLGLISQPVNDEGEAVVTLHLERLRPTGPASLGAVPAFQRMNPGGKISYVQVPGSIASLEPIVLPLLPAPILMDGKLQVGFVTPFCNNPLSPRAGISIYLELLADGEVIESARYEGKYYSIDFERIQSAGIITLRVRQVYSVKGCRTARAAPVVLMPVADEIPIFINPQTLAMRM